MSPAADSNESKQTSRPDPISNTTQNKVLSVLKETRDQPLTSYDQKNKQKNNHKHMHKIHKTGFVFQLEKRKEEDEEVKGPMSNRTLI